MLTKIEIRNILIEILFIHNSLFCIPPTIRVTNDIIFNSISITYTLMNGLVYTFDKSFSIFRGKEYIDKVILSYFDGVARSVRAISTYTTQPSDDDSGPVIQSSWGTDGERYWGIDVARGEDRSVTVKCRPYTSNIKEVRELHELFNEVDEIMRDAPTYINIKLEG